MLGLKITESLPTEESEGLTHGDQHPWRNFWLLSLRLKKTPNYMGWSDGPAAVNDKPPATVGSGFHEQSNTVRIYFWPTRKKKGRFFNCTSLFLSFFRVFFAPLSACTAQEGIWPSAAKAWFTPPQKAVYSLVGNIYVITLFPEHSTLQMNSNCLARYQYNKLKRSKAHSPTAALERCRPLQERMASTVPGPRDSLF